MTLVVRRFEFVVAPVLKSHDDVRVSSVVVALDPDSLGAGLDRISKFGSQCLADMLLEVVIGISSILRVSRIEGCLFIGWTLIYVVEKSAVIPNHDIDIAFSVNVRVIAIGALEKNLEITILVGRVPILKGCLHRRVSVLGLRNRTLTRPRLKLGKRNCHAIRRFLLHSQISNFLRACSWAAKDSQPR